MSCRKPEAAGHDAVHLRDLGMQAAPDPAVLQCSQADGRVLVSADTDFGGLLARSRAAGPSVLLIRRQAGRRTAEQSAIILANLDQIAEDLAVGAVVIYWRRLDPDTPSPNARLTRLAARPNCHGRISPRSTSEAPPLRGTASGAPRGGLWPWGGPPGAPAPSRPGRCR
jgi:predicted nuclease of predicted toxin-antitoxin system